jgi:hypothetical protein
LAKSVAWSKKTQIQQENGISNGLAGAILHAAGKWRTKGGGPSKETKKNKASVHTRIPAVENEPGLEEMN